MTATTRPEKSVREPTRDVACEWGKKEWQLAMTSGLGVDPWWRTVASGDWRGVERALAQGRARFGLPAVGPVLSCSEAGRDGCWIPRALEQRGLGHRVVDSAGIEVHRRARRAHTDRRDARTRVRRLVRVCAGDRDAWSEGRVPRVAGEAARPVSRERTAVTEEQTRLIHQLRGWLATWGSARPRRRPTRWWTDGAGLGGGPAARRRARAARPGRGAPRGARGADRGARRPATGRRDPRRAGECAPPVGAVERHRDDGRVGVARRGAGVARAPASAPDRRARGVCADARQQRGVGAGARDQSRRQSPVAIDQHSARVEWGALATAQRADAVVSGAGRDGDTRPSDWHRGGGAQARDRAVAVCDDRRGPRGRDPESRVDR